MSNTLAACYERKDPVAAEKALPGSARSNVQTGTEICIKKQSKKTTTTTKPKQTNPPPPPPLHPPPDDPKKRKHYIKEMTATGHQHWPVLKLYRPRWQSQHTEAERDVWPCLQVVYYAQRRSGTVQLLYT